MYQNYSLRAKTAYLLDVITIGVTANLKTVLVPYI